MDNNNSVHKYFNKTQKNNSFSRRRFLKTSTLAAASLVASAKLPTSSAFAIPRYKRPADLPKAKGLRCVIIGGGWSGLTMAKYLKAQNPLFDIVLIEPKAIFNSAIFSNPWLVNAVTTDFTQFSYINAARNNNYLYMQASAIDVNKSKRIVYTDKGFLKFEYLIIAPGIDYDYERFGIQDKALQATLQQNFPAAYQNSSELLTLKHKIQDFVGGNFVLTVPQGNYRCMSGPYERACLIADYFKTEKIDGKVIILDQNRQPRIMANQFMEAFQGTYKNQISYHSETKISDIAPDKKYIDTSHGQIEFEEASIYPPVRAAKLLENIGLSSKKSIQKEANIHPLKYQANRQKYIFVIGDARPQPFAKSASTAYSEARYVAQVINAHFNDSEIPWQSPETISYNLLGKSSALSVKYSTRYGTNDKGKSWFITQTNIPPKPSKDFSKERISWGKKLYNDMIES